MMNPAVVALAMFACVFGGALLGLRLQRVLPVSGAPLEEALHSLGR